MASAAGYSIASMTARVAMRMALLDVAFHLMNSVRSPQDFSLILHFRDAPNLDGLYEGARSAMNRFPTSASCINGQSPTASRRSNKIRRAGYQWSPSVRLALTITRRFPGELSKSSGNNSFFR